MGASRVQSPGPRRTPERGSGEGRLPALPRRRAGILLLDDFGRLLAAAPLVSDFLAACPGLRVLATSREALQLQAEHRYAVSPLQVPEAGALEAVAQAAAGALFVERARSRDRTFELTSRHAQAIASVCRRSTDCRLRSSWPAARMGVLGPEELDARIAQALDALGSGPRTPPRGSGRCAPRSSGATAY